MTKVNKTLLCILDGFAFGDQTFEYNAYARANKKFFPYALKHYPWVNIKCSGAAVGLPEGQMGNSEVGHVTIGSGVVIPQMLDRISLSLKNDDIKENTYISNILQTNLTTDVHLIGLFSSGGVHSHGSHIIEFAKMLSSSKRKTWIHIITDGRDCPTKDSLGYISSAIIELSKYNVQIGSISGRYFAMDRDNRWDRIEQYYNAILGFDTQEIVSITEYIKSCYSNDVTDEFIQPRIIKSFKGIQNEDNVIFCNFRADRMRQLANAIRLNEDNFSHFHRKRICKINLATMTDYILESSPNAVTNVISVLFEKEKIHNTLSEIVSKAGLQQIKIAETEKYAHVTFFLNGEVEEPFYGERRILIPSPKVKYYDETPEMSAYAVCEAIINAMKNTKEDLIVCNVANGDMIGHTGNFQATIKAVEIIDDILSKIYAIAKENKYNIIITADHGNIECMQDNNEKHTQHTTGDVPLILIKNNACINDLQGINSLADIKKLTLKTLGLDEK